MTTGVGTVTQGTIGALNAAVGIDALNAGSLAVQITGTYVGALAFQGSIDGTNWFSVNALPVIGGTVVTGNTANGQWVIGVAGLAQFRVICTAYTSGTATVNICASVASQVSTATALAAGSGGAATIADGADVAQGTTTDAAVTNPASAATEIALLKGLVTLLATQNALPNIQPSLGAAGIATQLFSATAAGSATLSKTKWPSTYAATLPAVGSGIAGFTALTESGVTVGGVFSPGPTWGGVFLDFAGVGNADLTTVIEIGSLAANGCMPSIIASVSLKSITTAGTFTASFNPFTGAAAAVTYRMYDLITVTSRGNLGQLLVNLGGLEDDTPAQMLLDVANHPYFFVLVRTLGLAGPIICAVTPVP